MYKLSGAAKRADEKLFQNDEELQFQEEQDCVDPSTNASFAVIQVFRVRSRGNFTEGNHGDFGAE
jgi:ABC-type antimicrobial peptide transport system ATPase subunit